MYYNGAECDIYIGKGAGKKLLNDIENAKESVKVVSPYLSPFLIKELIKLKEKGIDVKLITTDNIEDFYGPYDKNIYELIIQNSQTDEIAVEKRKEWGDIIKILLYVITGLIASLAGLMYFIRDVRLILGLIPIVILFSISRLYKSKIKNKRIYTYWYSQFFPFKVYMSPNSNKLSKTFIHGKIYLIDNQIAYLGSLNFTSSGTQYNYETRIRTTDSKAIAEINEELDQLFHNTDLPEIDIQVWGKELYREPIN